MPLVEVSDLRVLFGSRAAVEGVSFTLERGERFGIIGESGSGKSLTALALAGLLPETAEWTGHIALDGQSLPRDERAMARLRGKRIGMVFQEPMTALNPLMRVGDQIAEAIAWAGRAGPVESDVGNLLVEVGLLARHAGRYPHELSGGQRQRVMIAMALASAPDLLIADEPTSALDAITQRVVLDLIGNVSAQREMTLIFISHDLRAVASLCDRVGVMHRGRMVEAGPTARVLSAPEAEYTRRLIAATRVPALATEARPAASALVTAQGLSRDYRSGGWLGRAKAFRALDEVSFTLEAGECVALVGPSGCGKTTLARIVAGLDTATSGRLQIGNASYRGADLPRHLRKDISLVFQDPFSSFDPRLSVGASLGEPLRLLGQMTPAERAERLGEAIGGVGLAPDMLSRFPHEFSGGQRQRLAIARAMITRPKLVILDEPVSALDVSVRGEVLALLARLRAEHGLTYLLISHDLDMVAAMADRLMVMEAGRIVEAGEPDELFARPQHGLTKALLAARLPALP